MKTSEHNLIKYPLSNLQQNIFADTEKLPLVTGLQQCSSCPDSWQNLGLSSGELVTWWLLWGHLRSAG